MTITRTVTCNGCGMSIDPRAWVGWYHHTPPGWTVAETRPLEGLRPGKQHYCPSCWTAMHQQRTAAPAGLEGE